MEKDRLVKLCDGHPYFLQYLSQLAQSDFSQTAEISKISTKDVDAVNTELAKVVFPNAFARLTDEQKWILFAVALFDHDAQLGALYYVSDLFYILIFYWYRVQHLKMLSRLRFQCELKVAGLARGCSVKAYTTFISFEIKTTARKSLIAKCLQFVLTSCSSFYNYLG